MHKQVTIFALLTTTLLLSCRVKLDAEVTRQDSLGHIDTVYKLLDSMPGYTDTGKTIFSDSIRVGF